MLSVLLILLTLGLVAVWSWSQMSYWRLLHCAYKLPVATPSIPVLGHLHHLFYSLTDMSQLTIDYTIHIMDKGINAACLWFGPLPTIIVYGKEDIQKIFSSSSIIKADELGIILMASKTMRYGVICTSGSIWKITRRSLNKLFHQKNLTQLVPTLNSNCHEMVEKLSEHDQGEPVDLFPYTMTTALQSVSHLIYGTRMYFDTNSKEFRDALSAIIGLPALVSKRIYNPWLKNDTFFRLLYKKEVERFHESWETFTNHYVKMTRDKNENQRKEEDEDGVNMVQLYSQLQQDYQLTDLDMNGEIYILYATGTDTVSVSTATCLLLLAYYNDVQDKVYEEIMSVVGLTEDVTIQDLVRMTYLEQVWKETLRWALIVPSVMRKATQDLQLSTCTLPKGFTVVVSLLGLQMNPKVFPNPKQFDPDRFSPEQNRATWLPFAGGHRNCVGEKYSKILMKFMIIHVLRSFKLTTSLDINNFRRKAHALYTSADGYYVMLERRS